MTPRHWFWQLWQVFLTKVLENLASKKLLIFLFCTWMLWKGKLNGEEFQWIALAALGVQGILDHKAPPRKFSGSGKGAPGAVSSGPPPGS